MSKKLFVTTPIFYVNDKPHIGHLYSAYAADTLARYYRGILGNENVWFSTGTDENSQKTVEAAKKAAKEVKAYTDELAAVWKSTFERLGIAFDDFIRTTEPRHKVAVESLIKKIEASGDIYKGKYEGWYCVGHEAFMKESELVNGMCPEHNRKAEWLVEENYFFRLSKYQGLLGRHLEQHPNFVLPESRFNEVKQFITSGIEDISISRATQAWGIPLPQDPKQVVYVWFDALINYLTTIGYPDAKYKPFWPGVHVVGKDIIKFHCVIWPAMLLSAGIEPPKQVVAHGFFTVDGKKISKSLGNAVDPLPLAEKYGSDALRYFLFREIPFGGDGDFSEEKLKERYTADLANGLGNLVSRVTNMLEKYTNGTYESGRKSAAPKEKTVQRAIESYEFHEALEHLWAQITEANRYIDIHEPWKKAAAGEDVSRDLSHLASWLEEINRQLYPLLPETSVKISAALQQPVKKAAPLFPRLP